MTRLFHRTILSMIAAMVLSVSPFLLHCAIAQEISTISSNELEEQIAQNKGKVIVVDFFATWCPPCRQEIPGFVALQEKYGSRGLVLIGVSLDEGPVSTIEAFARDMGIHYTLYQAGNDVSRKYRIRAIPTTFIYDKSGKKVKTHIGFVSQEEFDKQLSSLLQS